MNTSLSKWFFCQKPNAQAQLRLFCFPYGGGGATIYYNWPKDLPEAVEMFAVQLPGRENRIGEPSFTQLHLLIQELADEIAPLLDKPFVFFGHSMGALIAYELAVELRRRFDKSPAHLFASSHPAPHLPRESSVHLLPDDEFWEHVRQMNGTPRDVLNNEELKQLVLPTLRADYEMCETYRHEQVPPLDCPITAYGGVQESAYTATFRAWAELTIAEFQFRMFPGDHFYLNTARDLLLGMLNYQLQKTIR